MHTKTISAIAALFCTAVLPATGAGAQTMHGGWTWNNPWGGSHCRLELMSLQKQDGQWTVTLKNSASTPLRVELAIRGMRPNTGVTGGGMTISLFVRTDRIPANQVQQIVKKEVYGSVPIGGGITTIVEVTACSVVA